jgi:hypothetical protein
MRHQLNVLNATVCWIGFVTMGTDEVYETMCDIPPWSWNASMHTDLDVSLVVALEVL